MTLLDDVEILIKMSEDSEWLVSNTRGVLKFHGYSKERFVVRCKDEKSFEGWKRNKKPVCLLVDQTPIRGLTLIMKGLFCKIHPST